MKFNSLTYTLFFLMISFVLIFFRLLPLSHLPTDWALPDLLLCITLAWCLRFPASAPIILLGFLFLIQDILFQRPPGLFAASAFVLCEWCKRQSSQALEFPFSLEWLTATTAMLMIFFLTQVVSMLSLISTPPLHLGLRETCVTIMAYPFVVLLLRFGISLKSFRRMGLSQRPGQEN